MSADRFAVPEVKVGTVVEQSFEVTVERIRLFAEATGDWNPIHLDPQFAARSRFGRTVAHGMLSAGFLSAVLGTVFPGPGTIWLSQTFRFTKPVFPGDRVTVRIEVTASDSKRSRATLRTTCYREVPSGDGREAVWEGEALVRLP